MQLYQVPGDGYFTEIIATFKKRTLQEQFPSAAVPDECHAPLPIAQYFLARTDDGTRAIGMAEAYFVDQVCDGFQFMKPTLAASLEPLCPFERLAFAGAFYVEPEFRSGPTYLYLHLALIHLASRLGGQGALCFTGVSSPWHRRLYEKTGGQMVTELDIYFSDQVRLRHAAYYFDLPKVLNHPRLERALELCHFDPDLAETTYNWRYDSSVSAPSVPTANAWN